MVQRLREKVGPATWAVRGRLGPMVFDSRGERCSSASVKLL